MASFLSNHPFDVKAWFDQSIVLTYALPKTTLAPLIPSCFELDTFNEHWAFIAVALVQTRQLRPAVFPAFCGQNFFLIGYRIFIRYQSASGKRMRGLYILKSDTDKQSMSFLGSIFSRYRYNKVDINVQQGPNHITIESRASDLDVALDTTAKEVSLPELSPFETWQQARKFAGPLPFTLSYDAAKCNVLIVEGQRQNWRPRPVTVQTHHIGYLVELGLHDAQLASAFIVEQIPYQWKKGRIEKWLR